MREFNKRRSRREEIIRFFAGVAGLVVLLIITVIMARAAWGMYLKFATAAGSSEQAGKELEILKKNEARVGAAVADLSTSRGVEQEIRERYGLSRPGEGQIQIVRDTGSTTQESAGDGNIFQRIWHAVFPW